MRNSNISDHQKLVFSVHVLIQHCLGSVDDLEHDLVLPVDIVPFQLDLHIVLLFTKTRV